MFLMLKIRQILTPLFKHFRKIDSFIKKYKKDDMINKNSMKLMNSEQP